MTARLLIICLMLTALLTPLRAEVGHQGREFWLAFMQNFDAEETAGALRVYISAEAPASGTVSLPLLGWQENFSLGARQSVMVEVPRNLGHTLRSETIQQTGVFVQADNEIAVYALNDRQQSSDMSIALPLDGLGDEYYVLSYPPLEVGGRVRPSQFLVLATEDETTVEISPSAPTFAGREAGKVFRVQLNAGETYQVQTDGDATGSYVRSVGARPEDRKQFAVLAGGVCATIGQCPACDHIVEQMLPTSAWGREFVTVPLASRLRGDIYRVLALRNDTEVEVRKDDDGGILARATLGQAEFLEYRTGTLATVSASGPVLLAQYSLGLGCDNIARSDPFFLLVNPIGQFCSGSAIFPTVPAIGVDDHFLNVVVKSDAVASARLGGVAIADQFRPFLSRPEYSWAQIDVVPQSNILEVGGEFSAFAYGFGEAVSYGFSAILGLEELAPCLAPQLSDERPAAVFETGVSGLQCDSLFIFNPRDEDLVLDRQSVALKTNQQFSLPSHQFPLRLGPRETRGIWLCFAPDALQSFSDVLTVVERCDLEVQIAGSGRPVSFQAASDCEVRLRAATASGTEGLALGQPFPNPAVSSVTIPYHHAAAGSALGFSLSLINNVGERFRPTIRAAVQSPLPNGRAYAEMTVDLGGLTPGLYTMLLQTGKATFLRRIAILD